VDTGEVQGALLVKSDDVRIGVGAAEQLKKDLEPPIGCGQEEGRLVEVVLQVYLDRGMGQEVLDDRQAPVPAGRVQEGVPVLGGVWGVDVVGGMLL